MRGEGKKWGEGGGKENVVSEVRWAKGEREYERGATKEIEKQVMGRGRGTFSRLLINQGKRVSRAGLCRSLLRKALN
jgi:hypothetical protein